MSKTFPLPQYQKVDTISPFSDGKPRAWRGQYPAPGWPSKSEKKPRMKAVFLSLGILPLFLGMGSFQMELRSNPVSPVIKSGCFWGCIVVLMTGWISLEWQGKNVLSEWFTSLPSFQHPGSSRNGYVVSLPMVMSQPQTGRWWSHSLVLCSGAWLLSLYFSIPTWCVGHFCHSIAVCCAHGPSAGQSTSIYISCPAVSLLTPICLMGQDEICVRSCLSGPRVGYPQSSRYCCQSVRPLGPQCLGLGDKEAFGKNLLGAGSWAHEGWFLGISILLCHV